MNTNPAEGVYQVLQETTQDTVHQRLHTLVRQGVPYIHYTEEWGQECDSDPVGDRGTPLPGANMGQYHHKTGIITSNIGRHPSENSGGIE